jgi:hypothetical protein
MKSKQTIQARLEERRTKGRSRRIYMDGIEEIARKMGPE